MPENYVEAVFRLLARDKALPKYQFERRLDALLAPFMEELLSTWMGQPVEAVVAEFPLKRRGDFRSTNVDHVFVCTTEGNAAPWIFFELKTDARSISDAQFARYAAAMNRGMTALISDLKSLAARSRFKKKYEASVERFSKLQLAGDGIRLVILAPVPVPAAARFGSSAEVRLFTDLATAEVTSYPVEWELFKAHILPVLL